MPNIGLLETIVVEFKSDIDKLNDQDLVDVVVALANTDGGEIYIGVEDDGEITGLHPEHKDPMHLAAMIANKTQPPISVKTEIISGDVPLILVHVPRSTSIRATTSGKILRRRLKADGTPENIPLYPYEIATRLSSLNLLDFSAQPVPGAEYSDLDSTERERLRNIIHFYHGEQMLLDLSDEELDKALQFTTTVDGKTIPTLTGLLLIGKKDRLYALIPTAESSIQAMLGTDIKVNESYVMPLLFVFEQFTEYMNAWNREEEIEDGIYRISVPEIDRRAFREALINAFCHRDYSVLGRVRVLINEQGLTISNPGGFIEGVTVDNLLYVEPHGRNPVLANALKRIGLAERTGRGIDRIFEGSLLYGKLLPDYSRSTENRVTLFIPKSLPDKAFIKMVSGEQKRLGRSLSVLTLMVLNALRHLHRATVLDIITEAKADESSVRVVLETLLESGLVEAIGNGKNRSYILSSKVYSFSDNTIGYVRQTDIDLIRHGELVLKLAGEQGYVTRSNVVDLLHINSAQAYRLLRRLYADGLLFLNGKGRYAKYSLNGKV